MWILSTSFLSSWFRCFLKAHPVQFASKEIAFTTTERKREKTLHKSYWTTSFAVVPLPCIWIICWPTEKNSSLVQGFQRCVPSAQLVLIGARFTAGSGITQGSNQEEAGTGCRQAQREAVWLPNAQINKKERTQFITRIQLNHLLLLAMQLARHRQAFLPVGGTVSQHFPSLTTAATDLGGKIMISKVPFKPIFL